MKILLLLFGLLPVLTGLAHEQSIELIAGTGTQQIFFVDCSELKCDSDSIRLIGEDGADVPFSLDWRYDLEPHADRHLATSGRHIRIPDGFTSRWFAPASENRFRRLGWLSFNKTPGVERYRLNFREGKPASARSNPTVRAWWMELFLDPELRNVKQLQSKNELIPLPDGGVECTTTFFWPKSMFCADSRLKGRRLLALARLSGDNECIVFNVPFRNQMSKDRPVVSCYAVANAEHDNAMDNLIEGRVDSSSDELFREPVQSGMHIFKSQPEKRSRVHFFHLQSPPEHGGVEIKINSSLFNLGDAVKIHTAGFGEEQLYTVRPGIERVDTWEPGGYTICSELQDTSGKVISVFQGDSFQLQDIPLGNCNLTVTLTSRRKIPENIATRIFPVEIQKGPDWEK